MPLINCKIHLELSWIKDFAMPSIVKATTFQITSTTLYVPIITLTSKDNVNLTKQLNEGFKRFVYWDEYKAKIEAREADEDNVPNFILMLLSKELKDCLLLLLTVLLTIITMVLIELKETIIENIFFQE